MKFLRNSAAIGLFLPLFSGCWSSPVQSSGSTVFSDDRSSATLLRSDMEGDWQACKDDGTLLVLHIQGDEVRLMAHVYADAACTGDRHETYKLAEYTYQDFQAADRRNGGARVQLSTQYPAGLAAENGLVTFDGAAFIQASAAFALSVDSTHLKLTLSEIKTRVRDRSERVVLDFKRGEAPKAQFSGVSVGGLSLDDMISFSSQAELISWMNRNAGSECASVYFTKPGIPELPDLEAGFTHDLLNERQPHNELIKAGYSTKDLQVMYVETKAKEPYLAFVLYYRDSHDDPMTEKTSSLACRLNRPAGVIFSAN